MPCRIFAALIAMVLSIAIACTPSARSGDPGEVDAQILKAAGIAPDSETLLRFLRQRALKDPEIKIEPSVARDATAAAARLLAARAEHGAIVALLHLLPGVDDTWLEDELLTSLGRLSVHQGKPDPRLLAALKDPIPARRAAAVYVLGRRADVGQRAVVRSFLADADPLVRARAAEGLLGKRSRQNLLESGSADEATLKAQQLAPTQEALLAFLRQRTPDAAQQGRLAGLVADFGSLEFAERAQAAEALVKAGTPALAFLKPALANTDPEVSRRARRCIEEIQRGAGPALPSAVVRRLAWPGLVKDVPTAIRDLLNFVPFAEDEALEDDVLTALTLLSVREEKLDSAFAAALGDALPARRGAAAYVLGSVAGAEQLDGVRKLLADPSPHVQLRAAQGLLAARDAVAVPKLIALIGVFPPATDWRIEETLNRLAGERTPPDTTGTGLDPRARQDAVQAWQKWWQENQTHIDLARAGEADAFLGLFTVCEYDNVVPGKFVGQVWDGPRLGPPRVKIGELAGPMDAQVLANGRMLIAENGASRVTERDRDGAVKWEYATQGGNPICCQRLANGNTFIALYNQLLEVRRDKTEVYRFSPGQQFYIFSARKTRSGTIVCITAQGGLIEVDPVQGKTLRSLNLGPNAGGWAGVEPLPNGNYLVATANNNTVREVDPRGNNVWSFNTIPGAFRATALPNGNILVVSMNAREVSEVDRAGTVRCKYPCQGRPWSVHYR